MANITVVATVTPNTLSSSGFDWTYSAAGNSDFTVPGSQTLKIPAGSSPKIMLNVVAGGPVSDTCVFQSPALGQDPQENPPLTFGSEIPTWYQDLQFLDASTILFMDVNTSSFTTTSYSVFINVAYSVTTVLDNTTTTTTTLVTSPDPTIVNVGTDGDMTFIFGKKASSQEQAKPTAVAA
ncbi:MAG TPA: hypothetical protein VLR69_19555 [Thermoanaerobaculia bacterium]|nr:hypothetical protein [Thermoanaerobaculia bacterium]